MKVVAVILAAAVCFSAATANLNDECATLCENAQAGYAVVLPHESKTVCLCHGTGRNQLVSHSVLQYDCNWDDYRFELDVKTFGRAEDNAVSIQERPLDSSRDSIENMVKIASNSCPARQLRTHQQSTPYKHPLARMSVKDGNLYHEIKVRITEALSDDNCAFDQYAYVFHYDLTLSCCPDPERDVQILTPPHHHYCDFDCTLIPQIDCKCIEVIVNGQPRYHFSAKPRSDAPLPFNVGYHMSRIVTMPSGIRADNSPNLPIITNGVYEKLHDHLDRQPQATPKSARKLTKYPPELVSTNKFVFAEPHRDAIVNVECNVEYCVIDPSLSNPHGYKPCRV